MALRINNNISAINAHRYVNSNDSALSKNLEHLSSGVKINRASDGPAALMISEHMRTQIAGMNQAIDNSETAVSMIQTTEANMAEVGGLLREIRQLAIHASNEGANDAAALEADQIEIANALDTIDRIAREARFGQRNLLDGSNGVSGSATGNNLEFVKATMATGDSRENGFAVKISQAASQASTTGTVALTDELIQQGERLSILENGRLASYTTTRDDTAETTVQNLQNEINRAGIKIDLVLNDQNQIMATHREFGSKNAFQLSSTTSGVLSKQGGELETISNGLDVRGYINGETATGEGQFLTGISGAKCVDGLTIRYKGDKEDVLEADCEVSDMQVEVEEELPPDEIPEGGKDVGRVYVTQNSVMFQVGGSQNQTVGISIRSLSPYALAESIANKSGFRSLADIDVRSFQGAQDTLKLVDDAMHQVMEDRGSLGAFQKNTLENNLSNLRVANENLISSESLIRDTDMAKEMAEFTKNQIKSQSSTAMLAQANQSPNTVQMLLG